ncbi:MAG: hypothetical protein KFW21_06035 [Spirochaetota bacterium]|nr:hypothetical protein [Spirochaetota bacterium]
MSCLGYLKDIKDDNERKKQEDLLFKSTKELMIKFVTLITDNCSQDTAKTDCKIVNLHNGSDQICFSEQGEEKEELVCLALYMLKKDNKLTDKQVKMIFDIIYGMLPCPIQISSIDSREQLYFILLDDQHKTIVHQEYIPDNQCFKPNLNEIENIVQSLNNEEWDSFIRTSIKELG